MGNTHFYLATSGYHGVTYQTQGLHDWVLATEFSSTLPTNQCGNAHSFLASYRWLPNGHQFFVVFYFVFLAICLFVCLCFQVLPWPGDGEGGLTIFPNFPKSLAKFVRFALAVMKLLLIKY